MHLTALPGVGWLLRHLGGVLWMPPNAAGHGQSLDRQMAVSITVMVAVFVLAQAVLLIAIRRPARASAALIPWWNVFTFWALTLLFVFLTVRAETLWAANRFQGPSYDALQVEVVGQQYVWYFRYPGADARFGTVRPELVDAAAGNPLGLDRKDPAAQDDFVSSELVLPLGREVNLRLRSLDVIHGFFVPAMRLKQNAVPGSVFNVHFTPTETGTYDIVCSQVCGSGHYRMEAQLRVITPDEFASWLATHTPATKQGLR
jgi:cytochrome c oxidase subunit 2